MILSIGNRFRLQHRERLNKKQTEELPQNWARSYPRQRFKPAASIFYHYRCYPLRMIGKCTLGVPIECDTFPLVTDSRSCSLCLTFRNFSPIFLSNRTKIKLALTSVGFTRARVWLLLSFSWYSPVQHAYIHSTHLNVYGNIVHVMSYADNSMRPSFSSWTYLNMFSVYYHTWTWSIG